MTATMRFNVQHRNIRPFRALDAWIQRQILALGSSRKIDEANIRLARLENASPAFHVSAHLVTPGPDVFAEARDHTLQAAFNKAVAQLREKIASRTRKQLLRRKNKVVQPGATFRGVRAS